MKPLIVLLAVFAIAVLGIRLFAEKYNFCLSAQIAMCAMLFFTAIGHFAFTKGMALMVPNFIPLKTQLVYLTGGSEILLAIGLLIPALRVHAAWVLIVFFVVLLPANINAAIKHIDYKKGSFNGPGVTYLWFRVPLQLLFIAWVYWSAIAC